MENTFPNVALRFVLVDDIIKGVYKDVYRFRNSVWITSAFILLIVIMGLIGYVNDETQRRSKEIAIRKVNGAEASHILRLLTRDILCVSCHFYPDRYGCVLFCRTGMARPVCRTD